jgi:DNA-entry nuclease
MFMKNISYICKKIILVFTIAALSLSIAGCSFSGSGASARANISSSSTAALEDVPDYAGCVFTTVNDNVPFFTEDELTTEPFEEYSEQDDLGRCQTAYANICEETMPTEERGDIGMIKPSGWHTAKYTDVVDGNYLYNRCHLIGFQLSGENANTQNLITGTRWFNVQGMLPFENAVADYVKSTDNHVLYRVTPVYDGDDLVASGVEIEALSVEDDTICFNVYIYNVQPGIDIDYSSGESSLASDYENEIEYASGTQEVLETEVDDIINGTLSEIDAEAVAETAENNENGSFSDDGKEHSYMINTNTKKFHLPDCPSINDIAQQNRREYTGTRSELIDKGYSPCGNCRP